MRAALLGAALAANDAHVFAAALDDRCTSPIAPGTRRISARSAADLPPGALGATLSGSGPTVIVWANDPRDAFSEPSYSAIQRTRSFPLEVTAAGAGPVPG